MNNGVVLFFTLLLAGFYFLYCIPVAAPLDTDVESVSRSPDARIIGSRPNCLRWHTVGKGETQWTLGKRHSSHGDTWQWIKSMRWISRKSEGDEDLKTGESVCISWVRSA